MTIKVGDKIPEATLAVMGEKGPQQVASGELFKGKTVALFAVPGAFTPTCSAKHLPGFVEHADDFKAKGVDQIVCLSVNDAFVMNAWGKDQNVGSKIAMVADGNAELTKKLGLEMDGSKFGMGARSQRYSMLVKDGVVEKLNVEDPGAFSASSAETLLGQL
ncbi:MAG: peroxiredoxin [Alphaproteobacteria bacterium]|jgi:peroxiredoxin